MPWTEKQLRLFRAAAHNPEIAKRTGIKQSDASRMSKEGLKKAGGGAIKQKILKQDTRHGKMDMPFAKLNKYAGMKEGGYMKESKSMMKKEIGFMQKKGAPASMIKHEKAEMKMARGGGIESRGKTKGKVIKMANGGFVRAADGCAQRGKTKGKMR